MKIAVLGGQFNPPHLGHIIMAQQVLEFTDTDQVWLAPCYQHTFDKKMALAKHRATMTKMICNKNIKFCDQEIKNKLSGDTIKLMDLLVKKYPQHEFSFIIGSDNLPDFKKWGRWEKLIKKYLFWVIPRAGYKPDLKKYGLDKPKFRFKIIKHPLLIITNISSTLIRGRIKRNLSITNLVTQRVNKYIKKHRIYQKS